MEKIKKLPTIAAQLEREEALRVESNSYLINTLKSGISFRKQSQNLSGSDSGSQDEDENQDKFYSGTFRDTNGRGS